jgi:hypothetical protein
MYGELLGKINDRQLSGTVSDGLPPPTVLPRLDRNNYQSVTIWTVHDWQNARKKNDDAGIRKKKGRPAKNTGSMTRESMAYIQDEWGKPVTEARARDICNEARKVFSKLEELNMAPQTWTKISSASSQYYRQVMYGYFPELQFCEGDWKAERLGIDIYPSWSRQRAEEDDAKIKKEESQDLVDEAEEISKKRKPSEYDNEEQEQRGKRVRSITELATTPNTSDYQGGLFIQSFSHLMTLTVRILLAALANSPSTVNDEATSAKEDGCHGIIDSAATQIATVASVPMNSTPTIPVPLAPVFKVCLLLLLSARLSHRSSYY